MQSNIQKLCEVRNSRIESLYERLLQVNNPQTQKQILQEIETVIGLKLIYD